LECINISSDNTITVSNTTDNCIIVNPRKVYLAEYFTVNATWVIPQNPSDSISFPGVNGKGVKIGQNRVSGNAIVLWEQESFTYFNGSKIIMSTYTPEIVDNVTYIVNNKTTYNITVYPAYWRNPLSVVSMENTSTIMEVLVWQEVLDIVPRLEFFPEIACSDYADCVIAFFRVSALIFPASNPSLVFKHIKGPNPVFNRTITTIFQSTASSLNPVAPLIVSIDATGMNALIGYKQGDGIPGQALVYITQYGIFPIPVSGSKSSSDNQNHLIIPIVSVTVAAVAVVAVAVPGYIWGIPRALVPIKNLCGCQKKELDKKVKLHSIRVKEENLEKGEHKMQSLEMM